MVKKENLANPIEQLIFCNKILYNDNIKFNYDITIIIINNFFLTKIIQLVDILSLYNY